MYCIKCGNSVNTGGKFCPHCGAALPDSSTKRVGKYEEKSSKEKERRLVIVGVIIFIVVVSIVGIILSKKDRIVGTYIGTEGSGILSLNSDETWRYYSKGWIEDLNESGTYEKKPSGTYTLNIEGSEHHLYVERVDESTIYVYSDSSDWIAEDFKLSE